MARFDIISKSNPDIKRYSGKPRYIGTYLKPSYIEFAEIATPSPIAWEVGDYVDYPHTGMRYRLYSIPQPTKKARKDTHGEAFVYSGVQFHAATKELEIALFRDIVSNDNNIHFSTSPDVNTFEDVYGIALRIQECMNDLYPDRWEIRVADFDDADIIEKVTTKKDFTLSGGTCLDALSKIYELWQDIGWIHTYDKNLGKEVITIGYANALRGDNVSEKFLHGKGNGLTAIKKNQTNKEEFATRLYVYGSERNLPPRYYSQMDFPNAESADIRNLMLPLDVWGLTNGSPDPRKAYLQNDEAVAKYGVIPKTHYFDSDDAGGDIYPTIERLTIGEVRGIIGAGGSYYPSDRYSDSERADAVLDAVNPNDDGVTNKDGKQYEAYTKEDLSWISPNSTIPDGSKEDITFNEVLFEVNFDLSGMGEISINPDMNFLIQGSEIEKVSASFEMTDDLTKQKELSITKDIEGKQLNDYTWSIAIPRMALKYNQREYDSFPAYLTMKITVTPKSSSERTVSLIPPTTPLRVNFARLLPTTFTMRLRQIGFNIEERAAQGKGKTISMKSGMCEGRNFIISSCKYDEANDSWDLVCKRQKDETLGILFPNIDYPIQPEDEFVLLDIAMPDLYVEAAMQRLLREGERLLARASKEMHNYEPSIDAKVMIESGRVLREGMFMEISDEDVVDNTTEYILIDTLNIHEDESAIPTYKVTLRERRKVTYKGTPSATTTSNTTSAEDGSEDSGDLANKLAALEFLKDMFYWHDEARTIIGTKHALFSEKTVASGGKAADGSGSGSGSTGGGFVILEDWLKYDATLPQVLGAVLGVELHNRLMAIENGSVTPDLTPYATVAFVEQTINNLIGGAGDAYDTLIEIQRILQDNEGDINTLLTEIATKASKEELASLDEKYAALIEALTTKDAAHDTAIEELKTKDVSHDEAITALQQKDEEHDTTLADHETRLETLEDKEDMFHWVYNADGTRRIETDYDLASLGTVASGGQAQKGEGGAAGTGTVMAVEVNGEIYDAEDGIVTLPDYPTKDEYDGKMSALDAKDKTFADDIAENTQEIGYLKPRVEKNEGDIKDLQVVDNDIKEQIADIRKITDRFSYDAEQDMLLTPSNLASQKTIASGGKGQQGSTSGVGDGIMAVKVNGQTISDDDGDRIIELPDYYTAEQSQAIEDRVSAVELNLDGKVSAEDLAPIATSGSYEDLGNKPKFKTVNGESIEGEGDIVIEANENTGSYIIHFPLSTEDPTLTEEQLAVNREAYEAYINAPSEKKPVLFTSMGNVILVDADFDSENGGLYLFHEFSMPVNLGSYTQLLYFGEEALLYSDGSLADYYMSMLEIPTTDALKTINGETIVGTGDIVIEGGGVDSEELESMLATKQDTIEDLEDIRSGASAGATALQEVPSEYITETELEEALEGKMDNVTLADVATSGSYNDLTDTPTFKTINGESIVGEGNITIEGGGSDVTIDEAMSDTSENAVQNKVIKAYADGVASDAEANAKAYTDEVVGAINTLLDTINGEAI